jgi:hypothetical protein
VVAVPEGRAVPVDRVPAGPMVPERVVPGAQADPEVAALAVLAALHSPVKSCPHSSRIC